MLNFLTPKWRSRPLFLCLALAATGTAMSWGFADGTRRGTAAPVPDDKAVTQRALRDLKIELRTAELALEQAEKDLPLLERSTALEIQAAERSAKRAADELERFVKSGKARAETEARMKWEDAQASVQEEIDRLHELEKLYRKGESAEANEKLVLERTRRGVETSKFNLEGKRQAFDLTLQVEIPAKEASLHEAVAKADLALDKAKATLSITLAQKKNALAKARSDVEKLKEKLERLQKASPSDR